MILNLESTLSGGRIRTGMLVRNIRGDFFSAHRPFAVIRIVGIGSISGVYPRATSFSGPAGRVDSVKERDVSGGRRRRTPSSRSRVGPFPLLTPGVIVSASF